jgi:hypothetical protein
MPPIQKMNLSKLPPMFWKKKMLALLSADGQVYAGCPACGWEHRVEMIGANSVKKVGKKLQRRCVRCRAKGPLAIVRHGLSIRFRCPDCQATGWTDVSLAGPVSCPDCASGRIEPLEERVEPPFPAEFGELGTPAWVLGKEPPHTWGRSGVDDANRINAEQQFNTMLPEHHRYHYLLILFAGRLSITSGYDDPDGRYMIANIEANLRQDYLRETGDVGAGVTAVDKFEQMIAFAPNEPTKALALHSFAMGVFSLLARWPEAYVAAVSGRPGIRQDAIEAALDAVRILDRYLDEGGEQAASQLARVHWVLGDLLSAGNTDDEQRRAALEHFAAAMDNPWVARNAGFAVAQSRGRVIMELPDPSDEQLQQAVTDLQLAATAGGSDRAYENRWLPMFYLGQLEMRYSGERQAGLTWLERAAAHALQQLTAGADEQQLIFQGERMTHVFELLAFRYVDYGWNDEALSAVEITRGASLRLYSMLKDDRDAWVAELQARQLEDLMPAAIRDSGLTLSRPVSERSMDEYFEENPIGPPVKEVLRAHQDLPTAFLCVFVAEIFPGDPIISALLCHMTGDDEWANRRHCWRPEPGDMEMLSAQRYVPPGPFRAPLLDRACTRGAQMLLSPIAEMISDAGIQRLIVSLPGVLTRLPVEAFAGEGLPAVQATYLPSVRFGADLVQRHQQARRDLRGARVLALGYEGDDMPEQATELRELQRIWGPALTVMPGEQCTKASVLTALAQPYDIIHVACHGTFDEVSPLDSALHFTSEAGNDARSLSAEDLLMYADLPASPLVVLSACSSIVTANSRTNSLHGLAGSLFRIGARAIVGSRWPVDDGAASVVMARFHRSLHDGGRPADLSLADACGQLRAEGFGLEDWAAFGYFGIP